MHPNCITGSRVTAFFDELVDFDYWWSFSGGGSAINRATPFSFTMSEGIHLNSPAESAIVYHGIDRAGREIGPA